MTTKFALVVFIAACAAGQTPAPRVLTLTLKEAVDLALQQNPDLVLARLDEQKAAQTVRVARDPFVLKLGAGSGLAYSSGFPMSIDGAAPSIFQARARQAIFNRPQSYLVAQARENARGAELSSAAKRDEVAFAAASLYLDAESATRESKIAREQEASLTKIAETVRARVAEGRELGIEDRRAQWNLAKARQRATQLEIERAIAQDTLAVVLGLGPGERAEVRVGAAREVPEIPPSEEAVAAAALENNRQVRRLESALLAKQFEIRSHKAARLPRIDLVAQYAMFAKFNNYEDYFRTFQRNNGQIGMSFEVPLLVGSAPSAMATQAELDAQRIRVEMNQLRAKINQDARRSYQDLVLAESGREVARLDLALAREQLSLLLAQMEEGRATLRQVEEARVSENERWLTFHDADYQVEKARLNILKQAGNILAAIR